MSAFVRKMLDKAFVPVICLFVSCMFQALIVHGVSKRKCLLGTQSKMGQEHLLVHTQTQNCETVKSECRGK